MLTGEHAALEFVPDSQTTFDWPSLGPARRRRHHALGPQPVTDRPIAAEAERVIAIRADASAVAEAGTLGTATETEMT